MDNKLGYLYWAAGNALNPLACVRFGRNGIEAGKLTSSTLGIAGVLHGKRTFVALGPSYDLSQRGIGLYGGLGFEIAVTSFLAARGEMTGSAHHNGTVLGEALLGVLLHL